ncbi:MAG TPA: hypothetical protein VE935_20770 [Burkholderiales bacterium]|nr:hypothetical protein [Burkholderiales bacterium]
MNREKPEERWPFDPMQPGDHEPARLPEEQERIQKRSGHGSHGTEPSPDYRKSEEQRK